MIGPGPRSPIAVDGEHVEVELDHIQVVGVADTGQSGRTPDPVYAGVRLDLLENDREQRSVSLGILARLAAVLEMTPDELLVLTSEPVDRARAEDRDSDPENVVLLLALVLTHDGVNVNEVLRGCGWSHERLAQAVADLRTKLASTALTVVTTDCRVSVVLRRGALPEHLRARFTDGLRRRAPLKPATAVGLHRLLCNHILALFPGSGADTEVVDRHDADYLIELDIAVAREDDIGGIAARVLDGHPELLFCPSAWPSGPNSPEGPLPTNTQRPIPPVAHRGSLTFADAQQFAHDRSRVGAVSPTGVSESCISPSFPGPSRRWRRRVRHRLGRSTAARPVPGHRSRSPRYLPSLGRQWLETCAISVLLPSATIGLPRRRAESLDQPRSRQVESEWDQVGLHPCRAGELAIGRLDHFAHVCGGHLREFGGKDTCHSVQLAVGQVWHRAGDNRCRVQRGDSHRLIVDCRLAHRVSPRWQLPHCSPLYEASPWAVVLIETSGLCVGISRTWDNSPPSGWFWKGPANKAGRSAHCLWTFGSRGECASTGGMDAGRMVAWKERSISVHMVKRVGQLVADGAVS